MISSFETYQLEAPALGQLWPELVKRGFAIAGPVRRQHSIDWDLQETADQLPVGWTTVQAPGSAALRRRDDEAWFGYANGQSGLKRFLSVPERQLFAAETGNGQFHILSNGPPPQPQAFIGVRACDLAALGIRDRVLLADRYADVSYAQRREGCFIVAVRCTACEPTCFCGSMNTGPDQMSGYDLCLTEVIRPNRHVFLIESGSERGAEVLHALGATAAEPKLAAEAQAGVSGMLAAQTRHIEQDQIKEQLYAAFDHPRWEEVAERCLACGNCTQVCPTCFCMNIEDSSDITGETAVRNVVADSCFSMQFSYIHGGSVRVSAKSRYRQWLMHKLAYWIDQFGSSGCVGCGRCITWCPVGIDITEEASALRKRV